MKKKHFFIFKGLSLKQVKLTFLKGEIPTLKGSCGTFGYEMCQSQKRSHKNLWYSVFL